MFKWIQPKICREDVAGARKLPASGGKEKCPPCNPGMFLNGTQCLYCPPNQFSDGNTGAFVYKFNYTCCTLFSWLLVGSPMMSSVILTCSLLKPADSIPQRTDLVMVTQVLYILNLQLDCCKYTDWFSLEFGT